MSAVTRQAVSGFALVAVLALLAYFAIMLIAGQVAHAQDASPVPVAVQATSDLADIVLKHKLLGALAIVYASLAKFLQLNQTQGWITHGRWLAILTGTGASLAALLEWKLGSGTLETFVLAAFGALMLIISPFTARPATAAA